MRVCDVQRSSTEVEVGFLRQHLQHLQEHAIAEVNLRKVRKGPTHSSHTLLLTHSQYPITYAPPTLL